MKISELISKLQYELDSSGDSEVYISIDSKDKDVDVSGDTLFTTNNLVTSLDANDNDDNTFSFGIRNWMM